MKAPQFNTRLNRTRSVGWMVVLDPSLRTPHFTFSRRSEERRAKADRHWHARRVVRVKELKKRIKKCRRRRSGRARTERRRIWGEGQFKIRYSRGGHGKDEEVGFRAWSAEINYIRQGEGQWKQTQFLETTGCAIPRPSTWGHYSFPELCNCNFE